MATENNRSPQWRGYRNSTLAMVGAASLALSLAACSPSAGEKGNSEGSPEGTAECTGAENIGAVLTTSGPIGLTGERMAIGAQMAVDQINEEGGIDGTCLNLIVTDDANDPTKGAQNARRLIHQEGAVAVVGSFGSAVTGAVLPVIAEGEIPQVVMAGIAEAGDPSINPFTFRMNLTSEQYGETLVKGAADLGATKAVVLVPNDQWGNDLSGFIKKHAADAGVEILAVEAHQGDEADLTGYVEKLRLAGDADVMIVGSHGTAGIAGAVARNAIGWDVKIIGLPTIVASSLLQRVTDASGEDGLKGMYAVGIPAVLTRDAQTGKPIGEVSAAFYDRVLASEGKVDDSFSGLAWGYDATMVIGQAMKNVNSTDPKAVRDEIAKNKFVGAMGPFSVTEKSHNGWSVENFPVIELGTLKDGLVDAPAGLKLP